ncbi:DUF998 domain-containing protein [Streptosporangium sp. NPDC048865]|uniref:DUF998 domain-containing protein n=1 Tax=Streptosporangium sp. NPDC048865 TaxID=3155766 RepID=UPI003437CA33
MSTMRERRLTRTLLTCGAVAGPLFILVVVIQDYTRTDFDPRRQPLSMLSLGDLGWIQIANFVVTGLLNIAFAAGLWRALHPRQDAGQDTDRSAGRGGTWGPLLIGAYGTGLVAAGVFRFEPAWGYPPGAPRGLPENPGLSYVLHGAAFFVVFVSLVAACSVFTRHFAARGERGWALYCAATGVALPALYVLAGALSDGGENSRPLSLLLRAIALLGWSWAAALAVRVRGSYMPARSGTG